MKYYGYILLALGVLIGIVIYRWNRYGKNVDFDFDFTNIGGIVGQLEQAVQTENNSLQKGSPNEKGIGLYLQIPLTTIIKNNKSTNLNLRDALVELSYQGEKIMRTAPDSSGITAKVPAGEEKSVTENVDVLINGKTLAFAKAFVKGEKPKLDYKIKTKLWGVTYSFQDSKLAEQK